MAKRPTYKAAIRGRRLLRREVNTDAIRIEAVLNKVGAYLPDFDMANDFQLAMEANAWARHLIAEHKLEPQDDILQDRIAVVEALARHAKADRATLLAALLYPPYAQLMKPPPYTRDNPDYLAILQERFGEEVTNIVRSTIIHRNLNLKPSLGSSPERQVPTQSEEERRERYLMMVLFESASEPRASLIRLTEMHVKVMNSYRVQSLQERLNLIQHVKDIYVPLASMAGFWLLRNAMANTVLRIENPSVFREIKAFRERYTKRFSFRHNDRSQRAVLENIKAQIEDALLRVEGDDTDDRYNKGDIRVEVRLKSIESIYNKVASKMEERQVPKSKWHAEIKKILEDDNLIHDFIGTRVILSDTHIARRAEETGKTIAEVEKEESLHIHMLMRNTRIDAIANFVPDTKRDKDYATTPKENGYSAVHGTYAITENVSITPQGKQPRKNKHQRKPKEIELQALSERMLHVNEYGPAAHVAYKADAAKPKVVRKAAKLKLTWLLVMREACQKLLPFEFAGKQQIVRNAKGGQTTEAVKELIAVYASNNDIIYLPAGATVADLAARLRIVAHAVGVTHIERPNFFHGLDLKSEIILDPEKPDIEHMRIRLHNGDRVEIKLDPAILAKERGRNSHRQSVILDALTNPDAYRELSRYFRNRKSPTTSSDLA